MMNGWLTIVLYKFYKIKQAALVENNSAVFFIIQTSKNRKFALHNLKEYHLVHEKHNPGIEPFC